MKARFTSTSHASQHHEAPWAKLARRGSPTLFHGGTFRGYTYLEVLLALLIFAIALVPAMEAIQFGMRGVRQGGVATATRNVSDEQAAINKMERLLAKTPAELGTSPSGRTTAHATLSDPVGTVPRCLVYTSWYQPEAATEASRFVGSSTSRLLWVKVAVEGSGASATTLVFVP